MSAAPGWCPDSLGETRYWDGERWLARVEPVPAAPATTAPPTVAPAAPVDARYRIVGQPGVSLGYSDFGSAAAAGVTGEQRVAGALEALLDEHPEAWLFHSVRLDGVAWEVDHVLVIGRLVFFIDSKNWRGGHDYLLQFDAHFDPPTWWVEGQPADPAYLRDRVLRWDRTPGAGWEEFDGSVIRLRGMAERFATEAGIGGQHEYRFVPLLVVAREDVTTRIDSEQPSWLQFTQLLDLPEVIRGVVAAEARYASVSDPELRALFTRYQANAIVSPNANALATVPAETALAAAPQPVYAAPMYAQVPQRPPSNGLAVAGFVVGLVSVFMPLVIGFVMAGVGLGLSIGGLVRAGRIAAGSGLAVAGLVLSIVGLLLII